MKVNAKRIQYANAVRSLMHRHLVSGTGHLIPMLQR